MGRRFIETPMYQERRIAANEPVEAIKEQPAQVGGWRQLPDMFDVPLPPLERCGFQRAVLLTVINRIQPNLESGVEIVQRAHVIAIDAGEKLFPDRSEVTFDLATPFRLIRRWMHDQDYARSAAGFQFSGTIDRSDVDLTLHPKPARP